jgi:hypothetical protein
MTYAVSFTFSAMEDAHTTILELDTTEKNSFFAVYDGHGGRFFPLFSIITDLLLTVVNLQLRRYDCQIFRGART